MGRGLAPFPDRRALFREGARAKHLDRDKSRPTEVEVLFSINGSLLLPCLLAFRLTKSPNCLIHNLKYSTVVTIRCATKKIALPSFVNLSFPSSPPTSLTVTRLKAQTAQPNKLKVSHICSSMSDDSISSCCAVIFVTGSFPLMMVEATSPI